MKTKQNKTKKVNVCLDYSYCSGVGCKISFTCHRYLPAEGREKQRPAKSLLWYVEPQYDDESGICPNRDDMLAF